MSQWRDTTSYSRYDKEREPSAWTIGNDSVSVTVTNRHIYYPGRWVMHCAALCIDARPLKEGISKEQAQAVALDYAARRAESIATALWGLARANT